MDKQIIRDARKLRLVSDVCPLDAASGLSNNKRHGGQCEQGPSDTEEGHQPEVELDVDAARQCALKAALTMRANRDQSDGQPGIPDAEQHVRPWRDMQQLWRQAPDPQRPRDCDEC